MRFIRWFTLLLYSDMQNFELDDETGKSVYRQIMKSMKKETKE